MKILPNDLVLEVGSGNNPRPRSDILTDRFLFDNSQRAGAFAVVVDRPFVVADGFHLPFKDHAFDYVLCSHVLEHLEDPLAFTKELMRVAKKGYIEVPSILSERLFGWDFHLWYCEFKDNRLIFTQKKEGERFGGFFHRLIASSVAVRRFHETHERKFYIRYEWNKRIDLTVIKKNKSQQELEKVDNELWNMMKKVHWSRQEDMVYSFRFFIRRIIHKVQKMKRQIFWNLTMVLNKEYVYQQLLPILLCPNCKKYTIDSEKGKLLCTSCHEVFPAVRNIPILLTKKDRKKGY